MSDTYYFSFGEEDKQWAAPNPRVASFQAMGEAYAYLVGACPDTKTAVAKLRQIRAKFRATPGQTKDGR